MRLFLAFGFLAVAGVSLSACGVICPTVGYPWLESATWSLKKEQLEITLFADHSEVKATFHFAGPPQQTQMVFPEDERDPPLQPFAVWFNKHPLAVEFDAPAGPLTRLVPQIRRWHAFHLPANSSAEPQILVVRYEQKLGQGGSLSNPRRFRYWLRTGAYWKGSIGRLIVRVHLRDGVKLALVRFGQHKCQRKDNQLLWELENIEPEDNLEIWLKAGPSKRISADEQAKPRRGCC